MLTSRVLTAGVLLAVFLMALFLLPPRLWDGLVLLVVAIGAAEWASLAGLDPRLRMAYVAATPLAGAMLLAAAAPVSGHATVAGFVALGGASIFWCLIAPFWLHGHWRPSRPGVLAAAGWIVLLPTALALSLLRAGGPELLLALMAVVWIADTAAYFTGKAFGRRKLAPAISPGKTWEGVGGALAGVTLYGLAIFALGAFPEAGVGLVTAVIAGLWAMVALSVLGDLFESLMKRQAGVKDSGRLLPGHGGILDRIDALTASLPPAAFGIILLRSLS